MKTFRSYMDESYAFQRGEYSVQYHENDEDRGGHYTVVHKGEELSKHPFSDMTKNAAPAYEAAKKHAISLHVEDDNKARAAREYDYQHNKPLTELETAWVGLHKKLMAAIKNKDYSMSDSDLSKYSRYGEVVRKSLRDGTHEAMK